MHKDPGQSRLRNSLSEFDNDSRKWKVRKSRQQVGTNQREGKKEIGQGQRGEGSERGLLFRVQVGDAGLNADGRSQERRGNSRHRGGWPGEAGWRGPQSLGQLRRQEEELGWGVGGLFCSIPLKVVPVMGISRRVHNNMWHLSGTYLWPGPGETLPYN